MGSGCIGGCHHPIHPASSALANLTATNRAALVQTPVVKRAPTGNRRGRPKATEVIARTNHTMDEFYRRKPVQSDAQMPLLNQEEEKK